MEQGTRHTLIVTSHENQGVTIIKLHGSLSATTAEKGSQEIKCGRENEKGKEKRSAFPYVLQIAPLWDSPMPNYAVPYIPTGVATYSPEK